LHCFLLHRSGFTIISTTVHISPLNTPQINLLTYNFLIRFTNDFVHSLPFLLLFLFFLSISCIHFCTFPFIDVIRILFPVLLLLSFLGFFLVFMKMLQCAQCTVSALYQLQAEQKTNKAHTLFRARFQSQFLAVGILLCLHFILLQT
jgi:hypothetical protein